MTSSRESRNDDVVGTIVSCLCGAVVVVLIVVLMLRCSGPLTLEQTVEVPKASGMPLDAIRYRSPTFADGDAAWRVEDRQSGSRWWLIRMGSEWLALPITSAQ